MVEECAVEFRPHFLSHPSRAVFIGASQSGKTWTIRRFLENQKELYGTEFSKVHLFSTCSSREYLKWTTEQPNLVIEDRTPSQYIETELSDDDGLDEDSEPRLLIFEDYMCQSRRNVDKRLVEYFTSLSNHKSVTLANYL